MLNYMLEKMKNKYTCHAIKTGDFGEMTIQGAKTSIRAFDVVGVGRVSKAEMVQMFGLVKMETLIINPLEKDMPIYYYERRMAKGKDFYRVEIFDTQMCPVDLADLDEVVKKYSAIADEVKKERWFDEAKLSGAVYKVGKKKQKEDMDQMAKEHFDAYMKLLEEAPKCTPSEKKKKASIFVDELATMGCLSLINVFILNYGEKITAKLCNEILFGLK